MAETIRITHRPTGIVIAEGPRGWGITPFEGNYYIGTRYLKTDAFRTNYIPGICPYKFLYVWLDFKPPGHEASRALGWRYIVPNPLLPFIAFRVAVPGSHPELEISEEHGVAAGSPIS